MRKIVVLLISLFCCASILNAQEIINFFEVGDNIATPVTIKTNLGTFLINGGESIRGAITSLSAYDADGDLIVQNTYYKSEWNSAHTYHYRYYRFLSVYNSSSQPNRSTSTSASNSNGLEQSIYRTTEGFKRTQGQLIDAAVGLSNVDMRGYPNLQLRSGISLLYGEYAALHAELGGKGGWILGAGIGKDFIRGDNSITWYGDFGMYMGDEEDLFVMGFIFGKHCTEAPKFSLFRSTEYQEDTEAEQMLRRIGMYIGWEHYFWSVPRLGFFAIAQLNFGSYDLRAGLSWKVFANIR